MINSMSDFQMPDPNRPGCPAKVHSSKVMTVAELDRLQAIFDASSKTQPGYCGASDGECPCAIIWMTPDVGFGTYNIEDDDPDDRSPGIPQKDIVAFIEARNALPELIRLARKALEEKK